MKNEADAAGGPTMEQILDGEAAAHPEPSAQAAVIAAEFADDLRKEMVNKGELPAQPPSPGSGIYPPDYDPAKHFWPPEKTTRGTWKMRKPGDAMPPPPPAAVDGARAQPVTAAPAALPVADAAERALHYVDTGLSVLTMVGGKAWAPNEVEALELRAAFARFIQSRNLPDIPPGWALLAVLCAYVAPRILALPYVQEKLRAAGVLPPLPEPSEPAVIASDNSNGEGDTAGGQDEGDGKPSARARKKKLKGLGAELAKRAQSARAEKDE